MLIPLTHPHYVPSISGFLRIPQPWQKYKHPNGDIYYYNHSLRLLTPDDIRDPHTLEMVLEAREAHVRELQGDPRFEQMADDWELTLMDVDEDCAIIGMHSRRLGVTYDFTDERGECVMAIYYVTIIDRATLQGLEIRPTKEQFWSHVSEYPSHHDALPLNAEAEFVRALSQGQSSASCDVVIAHPLPTCQLRRLLKKV